MSKKDEFIAGLQDQIKTSSSLSIKSGGSKTALSNNANIDLSVLTGVLEYDPQEYTLTALAGTPLKEIEALLSAQGQYMPFDPVLVDEGATLGGTIASGLSGSGRYRYGGIRDFLLGIRFLTGSGQLHTGGGKVIKNASGFDLPKLMVGGLGRFGVVTEATIKVFPAPEVFTTLKFELSNLETALDAMRKLATSSFELSCLDVTHEGTLWLRFGGLKDAAKKRLERIQLFLATEGEVLQDKADAKVWQDARSFKRLTKKNSLIKVPVTLSKIPTLDASLPKDTIRRYSVGGNVAYIGLPKSVDQQEISDLLLEQNLAGLAIMGDWDNVYLGKQTGQAFVERILKVLDAQEKFKPAA